MGLVTKSRDHVILMFISGKNKIPGQDGQQQAFSLQKCLASRRVSQLVSCLLSYPHVYHVVQEQALVKQLAAVLCRGSLHQDK